MGLHVTEVEKKKKNEKRVGFFGMFYFVYQNILIAVTSLSERKNG